MRHLLFAIAIAAGLCSVASGQSGSQPERNNYWESRPSARDFERLYPRRAADMGSAGVVVMCCTPKPERDLSCTVAYENPPDLGFGHAGLEMSKVFRLTPAEYEKRKSEPPFRLPITFLLGGPASKVLQAQLDKIREATADICNTTQPAS